MNKKAFNKKAFIFTLDAVIALILAAVIIAAIHFNFSQQQPYAETNLVQISSDSLAILEKNSDLKNAVQGNDLSGLQLFADTMPYQFCSNLTLKDENEDYIASVQRSCNLTGQQAIARRVFIANESIFLAEMRASYR